MNFEKYKKDLNTLRTMCDDINIGHIEKYNTSADNFRIRKEVSDSNEFFVVDNNNKNNFCGHEMIPFKENEWVKFWKITKDIFPMFSVNHQDSISLSQCEEIRRFQKCEYYYSLESKDFLLRDNYSVLEIGCGYGGVGKYLIDNKSCNYYAIDYYLNCDELKEYKDNYGNDRFIEINKSGIPNILKKCKFNMVYSSNVFQHITHKQKEEYFREISNVLTDDGIFYFDVFSWNFDYSNKQRDGFSCKFFIAETEIESEKEIETMLNECGLKIFLKNQDPYNVRNKNENKPIGYYCKKV